MWCDLPNDLWTPGLEVIGAGGSQNPIRMHSQSLVQANLPSSEDWVWDFGSIHMPAFLSCPSIFFRSATRSLNLCRYLWPPLGRLQPISVFCRQLELVGSGHYHPFFFSRPASAGLGIAQSARSESHLETSPPRARSPLARAAALGKRKKKR